MQDTGTGRSAYVFGGNAKETPIESKHYTVLQYLM